MSDNYYNNQYPSSGNQNYSSGPRDSYSQPDPQRYGGRDIHSNQNAYVPPPQSGAGYDTYRPPTDEGYRSSPVPPNMQVTQYDDQRSRNDRHRRSNSHTSRRSRYGDDSSYDDRDRYSDRPSGGYLDPRSSNSRPSSRGSNKERKMSRESETKSIGAAILGGVAGALIGRKAGNKDILPTVIGGVAGAWGGHKIEGEVAERRSENRSEKRSKSRSRRQSNDDDYDSYTGRGRRNSDESEKKSFGEKIKDRVRSMSRGAQARLSGRSSSRGGGDRRARSESDDSDYEDQRRRRRDDRRHEVDSAYSSEPRDRYDRRDNRRDDRDRYDRY